jgi:hypothetical protein
MLRRRYGVEKAATRADVIKLFPATACSVWQDPLYAPIVVCRKAHTRHPCDYWLFPALLDYHELYPVSLVITGHDQIRLSW